VEHGSKGKIKQAEPVPPSIIFGVRPCDTHGLDVLDRVMLDGDEDAHYKRRRESFMIFALACAKAGKNCFCESMGAGEAVKFDLLFTDKGKHFIVEIGSARGREITRLPFFKKTAARTKISGPACRKRIEAASLEKSMSSGFTSRIWKETSERCLSCASCTSVCPTCYCFDLQHSRPPGGEALAKRTANYCMLRDFTKVAGGCVFREPRDERVKQFFYHKLVYGKRNQGKLHCVGCGRCIKECMTHIDITEEAEKIRKEYERIKAKPLRAANR
jgi:ferredoxin